MIRVACLAVLLLPSWVFADGGISYENDIRPVFRKHCVSCHNPERPRGELDLTTFAATLQGGVSGKAVITGKADQSVLYTMTAHLEDPKMPPNSPKIPERELVLLKKWIDGGLVEKSTDARPMVGSVTQGELVALMPLSRRSPLAALAVNPVSSVIAVPGVKQVLLYDPKAAKWLGGVAFPEGEVHALRFSADGSLLLAGGGIGGQSGVVVGFDTTEWKRRFTLGEEVDAVLTCDISPDKTRVAIGGPLRAVKVFNVSDGKLLHTFRKPTDWVTAVVFSPDGLLIAGADRFGSLFLWETESGAEYAILRGHSKSITSLSWKQDGDTISSASEDGTIRAWDVHRKVEVQKFTAHESGVLGIEWIGKNQLVSGGRDAQLKLWDATGKLLFAWGPMTDHVLRVATLTNDGGLVSADWSGALRIWSRDGEKSRDIELPIATVRVSAAPVLPASPMARVMATPALSGDAAMQAAQQEVDRAQTELLAAQVELAKAKRVLAYRAANAALAQLKLASAAEPGNVALQQAVREADAALQSLIKP